MLHRLRLALKGRLPDATKNIYLKLRELNAGRRALPDFLIIGAMKSGTTSLFNYLCQHPRVIGSVPKEIFYLCSHPEEGECWYRRHFPLSSKLEARQALCGEATPTSFYSEQAAQLAQQLVPQAKIIVLLREPAARAVSHYYHRVRAGREMRSIDEVFSAPMIERIATGSPEGETEQVLYDRGDYPSGLQNWQACFPRKQLLVLEAETLFREPQATLNQVCEFLELPHTNLHVGQIFNANTSTKQKPKRFRELQQAFGKQNRELAKIGYSFSWMADA